ncbi:hypothetical protein [Streptomyces qinglanensis]|uniref:hypothetical protein n=1 Tax=Streptomyces qinglanensis TaxID=943816 RepID=UPI003D728D47
MALLKKMDWNDNEVPYASAEVIRYEGRVRRVRAEVNEIRAAVHTMREGGGAFLEEVASFLDREALQLERANEADGSVELPEQEDTRERNGLVPTGARRALLIARAFTSTHGGGGRG